MKRKVGEINKMKIAIDIDGTLNDAQKESIVNGMIFCSERNIETNNPDFNKLFAKDIYNLTDEQAKEFDNIFFKQVVRNGMVKKYAKETINRIKNLLGIDVYILTARESDYDDPDVSYKGFMMVEDTYKWFRDNQINIPTDHIIFDVKEKGKYCKMNGFDLLIDDESRHVENCVEYGIPVILMTQPYNTETLNKYADNPNVYDGQDDWTVIYEIICHILKKKA